MDKKHFTLAVLLALASLSGCQPDAQPIERTVAASAPAVAAPVAATEQAPVAAEPAAKPTVPLSKELQLAQANGCLSCHAVDAKLVGPAWKSVAEKYRGQKGAEGKLIDKVAKGGGGVWGAVSMPPNIRVSQADIKTLVRYILSLK
jgi:cytochrome c